MIKKTKLTQEEEVIRMLKREGFRELTKEEIKRKPYKSIYKRPVCFKKSND